MSVAVLYLPGILSSTMYRQTAFPFPRQTVWLDAIQIVGGAAAELQLAPDGISPGPLAGGSVVVPGPPLFEFNGLMEAFLISRGYDLLPLGYDWRRSIIDTAVSMWPLVKAWLAGRQLFIVAHSMGGLVARALWQQMVTDGQGGLLARLICLGTPHFGSWETYRAFWRQAQLYTWLAALVLAGRPLTPGLSIDYLDAVIATWPSFFQLMPFANVGWFTQLTKNQRDLVYSQYWYLGGNPYVFQPALDAAVGIQTALSFMMPTQQLVNIVGVGVPTAFELATPGAPGRLPTYTNFAAGDGTVPAISAEVPQATNHEGPWLHFLLPSYGDVQAIVAGTIG